jgi:chromosome segregation ATPase
LSPFSAAIFPHCVDFQNEILHVARQDPMQLCALFERVSGSMKLKGQYDEKKRIKRQAEEKHAEEAEQRSALAKRKGAIKAQKEEAEKYQQCQKEQVL